MRNALLLLVAVCGACCGTIKHEEFSAMAERECPDLLAAAEGSDVSKLRASEIKLIEWCMEMELNGYE
jgi:hypothetical protein